jgi:hypothetical protein
MTLRGIWILNFGTTVSLVVFLSLGLLQNVNLDESEKDIIIVYLVAFAGLYLFFLTYMFYQRIYKWGTKRRGPFFISTLLTLIISLIILFQVILTAGGHFTVRLTLISILCGLNIVTYFWGLQRNQASK